MSEIEPSQAKRTSMLSWYSVYQTQVVGQPKTLWTSEDPKKMSNGYDGDSRVRSSDEPMLDWNHSKDSETWNHSKDSETWNHSKDSDTWNHSKESDTWNHSKDADHIKDGDDPETNKFPGHAVPLENGSSSQTLLRPLSMNIEWTEHGRDEAEPQLHRSWSSVHNWDDVYEEFKLPKRYQKPTNTKINPRLSRTYITGAGNEKCKKCGQRLYEMEKINANHSSYHRTCFQCSRCHRLLSLTTFISIDGQLYCKSHFLDVVSNKPNTPVTETQMSKTLEEKNPHLPAALEINKEVDGKMTLTSIADIKSRFEIPSNNQIESEKTANIKEPKKFLQLTKDVDTEEVQQLKQRFDDSASPHENMPFELNAVHKSTRHTMQTEEAFATPQFTTSPFISNGEDDVIPIADAFAKFKNMESMHTERIQSSEIKPMVKIALPMHDIKSSAKGSFPENKEIGNHLPSNSDIWNDKPEKKMPTVHIQEPATKNKTSPVSKDSIKSAEAKRTEVDYQGCDNDVPPVGTTKRLVTQWKLMDTPDGTHVHRSNALVASTSSLGHSSNEMPLHGAAAEKNAAVAHSVQLVNGFHATEAGSSHENNLERIRRHGVLVQQDTEHVTKNVGHETTPIGPIDFTRNQLAKFKELEAMAHKSANPYPPPKKDFRWGVKEVSPLHRPSVSNLPPAVVQNGLKTDDHPAKQLIAATHAPLADQPDTFEQQPTLQGIKETLAQFKSMEDLTRPPPTPVLALSKQKAAVATPMQQYHDVIHVSYTVQTVKD